MTAPTAPAPRTIAELVVDAIDRLLALDPPPDITERLLALAERLDPSPPAIVAHRLPDGRVELVDLDAA